MVCTRPEPVLLRRLLTGLDSIGWSHRGSTDVLISGISYDSSKVAEGDLFCCVRGNKFDGHDFATGAVEAGAAALIVEEWIETAPASECTQVRVVSSRRAMARVACEFFGNPSKRMSIVGITGTNGKTSTAFMTESVLRNAGFTTGLLGTIETRIAGRSEPAGRTTPEAPDLQYLLWQMTQEGVQAVAMEVSSHALTLGRTDGTEFRVGVFTNLTQDHLDFHGTLENYYLSKRRLFEDGAVHTAVVNLDDPWARRIPIEIPGIETIQYSLSPNEAASIWADGIKFSDGFVRFSLEGVAGSHQVQLSVPARFAISNALAAAAAGVAMEIDGDVIAEGLSRTGAIPGRFELVRRGQPFLVVVDYAHTPDAITSVLASAREQVVDDGEVHIVVGCGGDRDCSKRPKMARAALDGANRAIFTSDNPRSEDPAEIIKEMIGGIDDASSEAYVVELDRRRAIAIALESAQPGDVVVIAGKGHEPGQIFGDVVLPFDDRDVVADELAALGFEELLSD